MAAGGAGDEAEVFLRAMAGVEPLGPGQRDRLPRRPAPKGPRLELVVDEELEVMARLADLVSGAGEFDLRYSDQYVQGSAPGVGPVLMERLVAGAFPVQDYLDLHGLTSESAMSAVEEFLSAAVLRGLRHVLIVHGKGHRSPGGEPVLKTMLVEALSTRRMQRWVLAFCSARAADGGTGAMYVLLRRWSGPGRW